MTLQDKKSKLKVSLVVSDLSSAGAGRWGGGVRSFLLAQALQKLNYQVEILGFVFGEEAGAISQTAIPISSFRGYQYPQFLLSASQLLKKLDGDIIYAMRPKPTTFGLSLLQQLKTRQPIILDIDDWEMSWYGGSDKWQYRPSPKQFYRDIFKGDGALRYPDHPFYLKMVEGMVQKANAITIHTNFLKERFGGIYLPNGKDTDLFNPDSYEPEECRAYYGLSGYRILMFPGAPRPYKGVEDVLMALDILDEPDLKLVIVGGSPYDDYDAQLIEKWGRWIIKLPKYPSTEMPKVVAAAHVIVVPQRNTPAALAQFPLKLTDGMAMAKPILATKVGDIPDILDETAYLVEPACPEEIAAQIKLIFQDLDAANERGIKARERCVEKYSIEAMASTLNSVIARL
ncbi:glycosyltransferase family 4 protein [Nostoc sp. UHCC 0702]|nr:glycosyltransferase family 4 protein [Nostoc sp. UHCC 0702]